MKLPRILALVLAGGTGGRLGALTDDRAKPSLPVAGTRFLASSQVRTSWRRGLRRGGASVAGIHSQRKLPR